MTCVYNPSYGGKYRWDGHGLSWAPGKNTRPNLKNNEIEKGFRYASNGKAPA
jgi:hypothetical protein